MPFSHNNIKFRVKSSHLFHSPKPEPEKGPMSFTFEYTDLGRIQTKAPPCISNRPPYYPKSILWGPLKALLTGRLALRVAASD